MHRNPRSATALCEQLCKVCIGSFTAACFILILHELLSLSIPVSCYIVYPCAYLKILHCNNSSMHCNSAQIVQWNPAKQQPL